jgi:hypothetical protein
MALSVKLYRVVGKGKDRRYVAIDLGRRGRRSNDALDWGFPLVRGSDSQRLPSSSETLGGAGGTGWSFGRESLSNRDSSTAIPQKEKSAGTREAIR